MQVQDQGAGGASARLEPARERHGGRGDSRCETPSANSFEHQILCRISLRVSIEHRGMDPNKLKIEHQHVFTFLYLPSDSGLDSLKPTHVCV